MDGFKLIAKPPKNLKLPLLLILNKYNKVIRFDAFNTLKKAVFNWEDQRKLEEFQIGQKTKEQM